MVSSHVAALIPANYGTKATVLQYVYNMTAAADVLAMARIEVNLSDIPEGSNVTVKWRNKPLLIRHRTAQQIARVQAVNLSDLRDQEPDNKRVQRPEWLVVIGICPHLGMFVRPHARFRKTVLPKFRVLIEALAYLRSHKGGSNLSHPLAYHGTM